MKTLKLKDCDGQVLVIVAVVLIALVGVVGLAIDGGRAYGVKVKLNSAVDAAAIAAATDIGEGETQARLEAEKYFNANYPDGYMGGTPEFIIDPDNWVTYYPNGNARITVSGRAEMNTSFMRIFGYETQHVSALAEVTRRAVDIAFVVDNTGSIGSAGPDVKLRSIDFVNKFQENYDRLALIKYAYGAEVPVPIRTASRGFPLSTVETEIDNFNFNGYTNCAEGFWQGLNQLDSVDQPASLRVIVFFTDGAPNTFSSYFDFSNNNPRRGSIRSSDELSEDADGLWRHNYINSFISSRNYCRDTSGCPDGFSDWQLADYLLGLPEFYNAHTADINGLASVYEEDPNDPDYHKFRVITGNGGGLFNGMPSGTRLVTQHNAGDSKYVLHDKVNNVSRNLLEAMAKDARQQGIWVYTLGLGDLVTQDSGPNNEPGEVILERMANDIDADVRYDDEPEGFYCHAESEAALEPCFNRVVEAIIRLSM